VRIPDETVRGRLELPLGDWRTVDGLRDSAVLAILVERGGDDFLVFNRRRDDLPYHAGQICFPGGAREGGEDAATCAVRAGRRSRPKPPSIRCRSPGSGSRGVTVS